MDIKFLKLAEDISKKSKDPSTKVGCVIYDELEEKIVSIGFNDFIKNCDRTYMTFEKPMKYRLIIHAEMNALLSNKQNLQNCIMYVTHLPCDNCLKHIASKGIKKIVCKYTDTNGKMFNEEMIEAIKRIIMATKIEIFNEKLEKMEF